MTPSRLSSHDEEQEEGEPEMNSRLPPPRQKRSAERLLPHRKKGSVQSAEACKGCQSSVGIRITEVKSQETYARF